ncbi:MAG: 50S ribosomal protein L22/unknown domain fusion protein [Pelotomaculum sp. PtaB.Bin104]|nr:MAG: 50S ribosomal protein L22/unknown domain fusion protein [Pelotomaculum sp. PtaB.Bin104]
MCKILLSINPTHVDNIFRGTKKYEFRKIRCRSKVEKMVIYSTAPIMKIVGEAEIINVIEGLPSYIWEQTAEFAGINKVLFDRYYEGRQKAVAYHLGKVKKYNTPMDLSDFGISYIPQSFVYLD